MRGPARPLLAVLAAAAAMVASGPVAAASDRFVPREPGFVVADVSRTAPDEALRALLTRWRADPDLEQARVDLARAFIERARTRREPRFFGRAEALLSTPAASPGAGPELRRLYVETLQFRHQFAAAESLLDELLLQWPHDADARLRRGSLRLTRGDFAGARADCARLALARGEFSGAGVACLAEALAGSGELARARILLDGMARDQAALPPATRAYLLATRAELAERDGDLGSAIGDYRRASALAPDDDSIRAALADALASQCDVDAFGANCRADVSAPLHVPNPSLALVVRQAALAGSPELKSRARQWLALESARGDDLHHREAALLALADGNAPAALAAARANFSTQRELADVRVLARAAALARDRDARQELLHWLRSTGFQDAVTEAVLAPPPRG